MVACLGWLTRPIVIRSHRNSPHTDAVNNARQIGLALFEFDAEYGKLPDASTISAVRKKTGTLMPLGTKTANDYLRQLIAAGIIDNEATFHAAIAGSKKPDNRIAGTHALEQGECGFSYLSGLSFSGNPARPILVTPLIPGTDRFDPTRFDGKAVILKLDNSVSSMSIGNDGHVMIFGQNLLDPENPVWGTDKPVIMWPE